MRPFPSAPAPDPSIHRQAQAAAAGEDVVGDALALAAQLSEKADTLGRDSLAYFSLLAELAAVDLTVARTVEPHLDALTILRQAGPLDLTPIGAADASGGSDGTPGGTWGVYAANAPGHGLRAHHRDGTVTISGTKAWCSLADRVDHALVTAETPDGGSGLYAIPLRHPGVSVDSTGWISRGLAALTTSTVTCERVPAVPVGGPGWYLSRPGFAWGGIAVAAVWFGGAVATGSLLLEQAGRREPDQVALMSIGRVDLALESARLVLESAATAIDAGRAEGLDGTVLALRARSIVAQSAERVMSIVGHGAGPAPLTQNEEHARRVADLTVYIRQHHAERDEAVLGGHLLATHREGGEGSGDPR